MSYRLPTNNELLFCPLSGTQEIGKNLNLYGTNGKWLMVDCGIKFGNLLLPSHDISFPNLSSLDLFIKDTVGLVLTHAHEDHIGALAYLPPFPFPVYATPFTYACLKVKLGKNFSRWKIHKIYNKRFTIDPFDLEWIHLTHSTLESEGIIIRTKAGNVFHTGDWKLDDNPIVGLPYDQKSLESLAQENILAMISDSTNASASGKEKSEEVVLHALHDIISKISGRIIVTCFASNIARLKSIIDVSSFYNRKIAILGSSIHRMINCAKESGYLTNIPDFLSIKTLLKKPLDQQLIICTGSQGEKRAALRTLANLGYKNFKLTKNDTVIFSSRIIPGNELDVFLLQNHILATGASLITTSDVPNIHVSGHAASEDLYQMYLWVKPQIAIPVHGELKHMQDHATIAQQAGVKKTVLLKNGMCMSLTLQKVIFSLESSDFIMDGNRIIDIRTHYLHERKKVSEEGALFISLCLNIDYSIHKLKIVFNLLFENNDPIITKLRQYISSVVKSVVSDPEHDLESYVKNHVKKFLKATIDKTPMIYIHIFFYD